MKKRKLLLATAAITTAFTCALGVSSCKDDNKTGDNGKDSQIVAVYQLYTANAEANGETVLTYEQWLESIKGAQGPAGPTGATGKSAYEIAKENGFTGTEAEWLASLKGADGSSSSSGKDGKSAYEIAKENGFEGTEAEWLESLKGAPGAAGGTGATGATGKSAYEIAKENGFEGTEAEWLESLKGAAGSAGSDGAAGAAGKSAYEIAKENGFEGTEAEWLESLKGSSGSAGVGIEGVYQTSEGLYIKFTDGTAKPVQNGGVEYPLLVVGDNEIELPVAIDSDTPSETTFNFYMLTSGTYLFRYGNTDIEMYYTFYDNKSHSEAKSSYDPYGDGDFAPAGEINGEEYWGTTIDITSGFKHEITLKNWSSSDTSFVITIEKVED